MKKEEIMNFMTSYLGLGMMSLAVLIRAKVFSTDDVGLFSYILSVSTIAGAFLTFGIPKIILKYYPEKRNTDFIKFFLKIQLWALVFIVVLSGTFNYLLQIEYLWYIVFFTCNFTLIQDLDMITIVQRKSVRSNFCQKIIFSLLDISFLMGLLFYSLDITVYITVYIFFKLSIIYLLLLLVRKGIFIKTHTKIEPNELRAMMYYGLFIMFNALTSVTISNIDKIMLKHYLDFSAIGIYSIAASLAGIIGSIGAVFLRSVPPKISKCLNENDIRKLDQVYKENAAKQLYLGIFFSICLISFSGEILNFLGKDYTRGIQVIVFLSLGKLFNIGTGMCGTIILLSKYYKYNLYFSLSLLAITVITNIIFIPKYGINGAAFATSATIILINSIKVGFVYKKYATHPFEMKNFKYFFSAAILSLFYYYINVNIELDLLKVIGLSLGGFIVYDLFLIFLRVEDTLTFKLLDKFKIIKFN